MDLDFHATYRKIIQNIDKSGRDYAEKKGQAFQAEELKHTILALEMKKFPSDWSINRKEMEARASDGYQKYISETAQAIKDEALAKAIYEKHRAEFEALRSLTSLEKTTRSAIGQ